MKEGMLLLCLPTPSLSLRTAGKLASESSLMIARRFYSSSAWLLLLGGMLMVLLGTGPYGARAQAEHVHRWSAAPSIASEMWSQKPFFQIGEDQPGDYQVLPGCNVTLKTLSGSHWEEADTCQNSGCSFANGKAKNWVVLDHWEANVPGGKFGWLDGNKKFVDIATTSDPKNWDAVTHYQAPPTTRPVTLTLYLTRIMHEAPATPRILGLPAGSEVVRLANRPQRPSFATLAPAFRLALLTGPLRMHGERAFLLPRGVRTG